VWCFIQDFALFHHLAQKPVAVIWPQTARDLGRRPHDHVKRERPVECEVDANRFGDGVGSRHDHEQIDVAFLVRNAVSIGAEKDDLVRVESFGDASREMPDRRHRDVRGRIAVWLYMPDRGTLRPDHPDSLSSAQSVMTEC